MKYTKPKSLPKQKAARGLHEVSVPPPGNSGDVLNGAIQGGLAGSQFGPIGGILGGAAGLGMGLFQSNAQDQANKVALKRNQFVKANELVDGVDITATQRGQYGQGSEGIPGTKPINVEGPELILRKVGDKFRIKHDLKGLPSHKEGGVDYVAQDKDIIIPKGKRTSVLNALKEGNHAKVEGIRVKLPKDTNPQGEAAKGLNGLTPQPYLPPVMMGQQPLYNDPMNRQGKYGAYPQAVAGLQDGSSEFYLQGQTGNPYPYGVVKNGQGSFYRHDDMPQLQPRNLLESGLGTSSIPSSLTSIPMVGGNTSPSSLGSSTGQETGQGGGLGNALKYASVVNNLLQGFSSPEKVQESYLDPVLNTYQDRSNPQRQQSNMVRNAQVANARNASGGNVSNLRSNQQIAEAENYSRRQGIDEREQGIADQVRFGNNQEINRVKAINNQKLDQYNAINGQARANQQAYKDAAFGQLSSLGNAQEQDAYKKSRDGALDNLEQGKLAYLNKIYDFQTNGKGGDLDWKGPGGYLGPLTPNSTTVKVDTDIYGRKKSSTSQTSLGIRRGKRK